LKKFLISSYPKGGEMTVDIQKVQENEVLVADLGKYKLYRIVENNDNSEMESTSESEG